MIKLSSDGAAVLSPVNQLTALSSKLAGWGSANPAGIFLPFKVSINSLLMCPKRIF